jgi:hypothetical protein
MERRAMKDFTIAFAYPYGNGFDPMWVAAREGLLLYEASKHPDERLLGSILKAGSCYVADNRERIGIDLVNTTQDDWVMMTDPDVGFEPTILEQYKKLIDQYPDARIISSRVNLLNGLPVFYYVDPENRCNVHYTYPFRGLREFDLMGTGIMAIHRSVFTTLFERLGHWHFFSKIIDSDGLGFGDDFSFCIRAKAAGFKLYGAWTIYGQHYKHGIPVPQAYLEYDQLMIKRPNLR